MSITGRRKKRRRRWRPAVDNSWTEGKSESTWLKIKAEMVAVEEVRDSVAEAVRDLEAADVRMEEDSEATEEEVEEGAVEVVAAVCLLVHGHHRRDHLYRRLFHLCLCRL